MNLYIYRAAMYLAQEAHHDKLVDMKRGGARYYSNTDRADAEQFDQMLTLATSRIEAFVARIDGKFDNEDLLKFGPLSANYKEDVVRILCDPLPPIL